MKPLKRTNLGSEIIERLGQIRHTCWVPHQFVGLLANGWDTSNLIRPVYQERPQAHDQSGNGIDEENDNGNQ